MLGNTTSPLRPQGVRTSPQGPSHEGPPNTLLGFEELKVLRAEFYDERGRKTPIVLFEAPNGTLLVPQNAIEWASKLKRAPKWLGEQYRRQRMASAPVSVPEQDAVDVIGEAPRRAPQG